MTLTEINMRRSSGILAVRWKDGLNAELSAELLRTHSPSAEVQGHGAGPPVLVAGKKDVGFVRMDPVGNYGVKITFDDGHDSGIFSWQQLRQFAERQDELWQAYLDRLSREGATREDRGVRLLAVKPDYSQ